MNRHNSRSRNSDQMEHTRMPRSNTSSMASGRIPTPLPQIKGVHIPNMGSNSVLSMKEVQHLAHIKEKKLIRSSVSCRNSDMQVPMAAGHNNAAHTDKKMVGEKKKKKRDVLDIVEAQEKMAEISRSRGMFNRTREALPQIGQPAPGPSFSAGKLPKIEEKYGAENNVIDVIKRHEATVNVLCKLKEASSDYMNVVGKSITAKHSNNAPEVILKNEGKVGKAYKGMSYDDFARTYGDRSYSRSQSRGSRKSS